MHLNQGKFSQNGRSGYVLMPEFMRNDSYDPYDSKTLNKVVEPIVLSVSVRKQNLFKVGKVLANFSTYKLADYCWKTSCETWERNRLPFCGSGNNGR